MDLVDTSTGPSPRRTGRSLVAAACVVGALALVACSANNPPDDLPDEAEASELPGDATSWDEAGEYIGSSQRVCGPLAGTGSSSDDVFLNLGRNYPDPERFTIVLWDVGGYGAPPTGTIVCASGRITVYKGVAEIELRSGSDVDVLD